MRNSNLWYVILLFSYITLSCLTLLTWQLKLIIAFYKLLMLLFFCWLAMLMISFWEWFSFSNDIGLCLLSSHHSLLSLLSYFLFYLETLTRRNTNRLQKCLLDISLIRVIYSDTEFSIFQLWLYVSAKSYAANIAIMKSYQKE